VRMSHISVSIIIPVYNVSAYIERCINSVICQTYPCKECIIVDDASLDDSIDKCKSIIEEYNGPIDFMLLHHNVNRGLSAARNTGTNAATGDYLFYLDSDDKLSNQCIEKLVAHINDDRSIEMVQGSYMCINNSKKEIHCTRDISIENNDAARRQYLKYRNLNYTVWNKLLKRSFVLDYKLYNKEGILNEDLLWTFYLIKYLSHAYLSSEITYFYYIRPDSITGKRLEERGLFFIQIYDEILRDLTRGKERDEIDGYLMNFCRLYATYNRSVPEFKRILCLYQTQAKRFKCWKTNVSLSILSLVCICFNPNGFLTILYRARRKWVK